MKHDELRSIAHNLADSLASGCRLLMGFYGVDIFAEAGNRRQGYIEVDFPGGTAALGVPAVDRALFDRPSGEHRIVVTVEEPKVGRRIFGIPAARVKVLDELGRIRTERRPRNG